MPKKQKITKRLDKLFGDFHPEEKTVSKKKGRPKVEKEAPALPSTPEPVQSSPESFPEPTIIETSPEPVIELNPEVESTPEIPIISETISEPTAIEKTPEPDVENINIPVVESTPEPVSSFEPPQITTPEIVFEAKPSIEPISEMPKAVEAEHKATDASPTMRQVKRHTSTLIPPEGFIPPTMEAGTSAFAVNFPIGSQDWATLRIQDDISKREWTVDEQLLISQVIDQLSVALENARLFQETQQALESTRAAELAVQRRNEYLAVSAEIGKLVTSTLDLNSIFTRTVKLISERFNFYHAAIFIVEETGFNAALREATGEAGAELKKKGHTFPVNNKSIVGKVIIDGEAVVANDVTNEPLYQVNPVLFETRSEAAIPLRIGNRTIGVLDMQSKFTNAFTEDEVSVLQTLADQVAIAIDNARSYELSQEAVKEMREIDRVKSQFLANMSHELRTPLNSIIGFSRVILKGIDGPVTELQQQDLTAIYNSGQHLLSLINDILDLAKIEAGKMELAFDEVNMTDVTSSVLSTMSGLVKDKPIQLKRIIEPDLPTVRADAIRVRQVMINLLSNAAKFTDEGDITVHVGLRPGPSGRVELQVDVTDTGPGISQADQAKLFQAFSQVDDSPTRKTGGTGLGLSICQHLISMHGGRIWVESEVGHGSTFSFTLPLFRNERDASVIGGNGQKVILAIDDDPQVIGLYERYLQPQGYHVVPLTDPSRAVERVKQLRPTAITLDIMMPGIDGWQVLDELKKDPEISNTPVIICSIIEDLERGFSLGAADYLVKPILEDDLVNALDRLNSDGSIREVLVIDDDPNDLRLISKILTDDGRYKTILAEGGISGWDIISSGNPPHAVIVDLFMPDLDGFKILENMRADKKLRDIPVIVISGQELTPENKDQLNQLGQRLLEKGSFTEKELLTNIHRALDRVHADK